MAQKREKDESVDLQLQAETPLSLSCSENNFKSLPATTSASTSFGSTAAGLEPVRIDRAEEARSRSGEATDELRHHPARKVEDRKRTAEVAGVEPVKRPVNRCTGCGKRVGLTGFRCRCGNLFCADHRYSDRHDCSYDYKTAGRAAIARENPVVRAAKILKV